MPAARATSVITISWSLRASASATNTPIPLLVKHPQTCRPDAIGFCAYLQARGINRFALHHFQVAASEDGEGRVAFCFGDFQDLGRRKIHEGAVEFVYFTT